MNFGSFLGNNALKERLSRALSQGKLSHCYLLCGPSGSGKHTLAQAIAAAMQCTGHNAPCGVCNACRKVFSGNHPDVITCVDPKHKQFGVESARTICADAYIRPNEGAYKIYIFPQEWNLAAQNAFLKLIEEPPPYAVFLLLSSNPDQLLPTVRSRCQELRLSPLPEATLLQALKQQFPDRTEADYRAAISVSSGYLGQALAMMAEGKLSARTAQFAQCYAQHDGLGLLALLIDMEKQKRDDFCAELERWKGLLYQALRCAAGLPGGEEAQRIANQREKAELLHAIAEIQKAMTYAKVNVGVGHLCGALREKI